MTNRKLVASALAEAFAREDFAVDGMVKRGAAILGRPWRWIRPLARRVIEAFEDVSHPRERAIAQFILSDAGFIRACETYELQVVQAICNPPSMRPVPDAAEWQLPSLRSPGELAAWLGVTNSQLAWLTDLRNLNARTNSEAISHYRYRVLAKRFGRVRLIEAPKPRMKALQRQILWEVLAQMPTHDAAHGFCLGRSIKTFAEPHVGRHIVLKIDLEDFFPSILAARVQGVFRTVGYPERVAELLAGLCTTVTPRYLWENAPTDVSQAMLRNIRWMYANRHLPQGAPTSPAFANLCAYRLDCRLSALASAAGAAYTRYADDLAFSGGSEFARVVRRFQTHVCATVVEEGFRVHHRKTRIMRRGVRQRLAGLTVNRQVNVPRVDFDRLKATLTNCVRHGPDSQNRQRHDDFRAHLQGRVAYVESINPTKGQRLRALFEQIAW